MKFEGQEWALLVDGTIESTFTSNGKPKKIYKVGDFEKKYYMDTLREKNGIPVICSIEVVKFANTRSELEQ